MRFTVKFEVDVDVDGWAKVREIGAGAALSEALAYVREASDPSKGQTLVTLVGPVQAFMDLGNLGNV